MANYPRLILLFSGKRKCGKDYVTDILTSRLDPEKTVIIKISAPIKSYWAKSKNLSLDELLSTGTMKELHRGQMIEWSEKERARDPGIFCREAIQLYKAEEKPVWIVSDIRRKSDIRWFRENYGERIKTVRIIASEQNRQKRGWVFTLGIDDAETECDLDDIDQWDFVVNNNCDEEELENFFQTACDLVGRTLKPSQ